MSTESVFLPDGSWADPLTRPERRELARLLASYSLRFWNAAEPGEIKRALTTGSALVQASREMAELHMDVTERAVTPPKEKR